MWPLEDDVLCPNGKMRLGHRQRITGIGQQPIHNALKKHRACSGGTKEVAAGSHLDVFQDVDGEHAAQRVRTQVFDESSQELVAVPE